MRLAEVVLVLSAGVAGCTQMASFTPNRLSAVDADAGGKILAVLPFSGNPALRRGAGEWLAHKLQANPHYRVLSPGMVETRLSSGTSLEVRPIDVEEARRLGAALGARMVLVGEVVAVTTAEIRVVVFDVSGAGQFSRSSLPRTFAENLSGVYPGTVAAVEEVAQSLLAELAARDARERAAASGAKP